MSVPLENSSVFPSLSVSQDEVEGNMEIGGKTKLAIFLRRVYIV